VSGPDSVSSNAEALYRQALATDEVGAGRRRGNPTVRGGCATSRAGPVARPALPRGNDAAASTPIIPGEQTRQPRSASLPSAESPRGVVQQAAPVPRCVDLVRTMSATSDSAPRTRAVEGVRPVIERISAEVRDLAEPSHETQSADAYASRGRGPR
jgi:hypothetical protein